MDQHTHLTSEKNSTCSSLSFDKCTCTIGGGGGGGDNCEESKINCVLFSHSKSLR